MYFYQDCRGYRRRFFRSIISFAIKSNVLSQGTIPSSISSNSFGDSSIFNRFSLMLSGCTSKRTLPPRDTTLIIPCVQGYVRHSCLLILRLEKRSLSMPIAISLLSQTHCVPFALFTIQSARNCASFNKSNLISLPVTLSIRCQFFGPFLAILNLPPADLYTPAE